MEQREQDAKNVREAVAAVRYRKQRKVTRAKTCRLLRKLAANTRGLNRRHRIYRLINVVREE